MSNVVTRLDLESEPTVQEERRMVRRFQNYWEALRGEHGYPLITELDLDEIREYVPYSFCLQLESSADDPTLRFVGKELNRDCGGDFTNKKLSELPEQSLLARSTKNLDRMLAERGPFTLSEGYYNPDGVEILYRTVLLPFSITGSEIDYIIGAVNRTDGHIIVLGSGKGGTGKSTTAMHLIASLLYRGDRVGSIDLDDFQCTLSRYIENRALINAQHDLKLPVPVHLAMTDWEFTAQALEGQILRLARSCDYVVIDTPGSDSELSRMAHSWADTLITPINDSFVDLDVLAVLDCNTREIQRLGQYAEMVVEARKQRQAQKGKPLEWIVLRNRLSNLEARNKRRMADTLEMLSTELDFRNGLGFSDRVIYRELFPLGLTLLDLHKDQTGVSLSMSHVAARQELRALMEAIKPPRAERKAIPA